MTNLIPAPGFPEWPMVCTLLMFLALGGAVAPLAGLAEERSRLQASLRPLIGLLLPAGVFLWLGAPVADWSLASPPLLLSRWPQIAALSMAGFLFAQLVPAKLRLQPFVLGLGLLVGSILPLAFAVETFARVHGTPTTLGIPCLLGLVLSGYIAPLLWASRTAPSETLPPHPDQARGVLHQVLAWVALALAQGRGTDQAPLLAALFVAMAAAITASLTFSWIRNGIVEPSALLDAPLAGILSALPSASHLGLPQAGLCGLAGAGSVLLLRHLLRKRLPGTSLDRIALLAGGSLAGALLAPWTAPFAAPSAGAAASAPGWALAFATLGLGMGLAFWSLLGQVVRLHPSAQEEIEGLDYCDLGVAAHRATP